MAGGRNGFYWDVVNSELEIEVQGTKVVGSTSSALTITPATTITGALTCSSTASVGDDLSIATGYLLKVGAAAEFSTVGTNGIAFLAGTAAAGTATNTCQLYSDNSGDDLSVEHADGTEDELTT